jgi:hypothetical protein
MPDEAYLLYTLGLARHPRAIALWDHVANEVDASEDAIRSMTAGTFAYVNAVAFGAERSGDPAAIPALARLHAYPSFRDQYRVAEYEPDVFQERRAMLELAIACAQARCGDLEGVHTLVAYLLDSRGPLRRQAHTELVLLAGADLGYRQAAWRAWVERIGTLEPQPLPLEADLLSPDGVGAMLSTAGAVSRDT